MVASVGKDSVRPADFAGEALSFHPVTGVMGSVSGAEQSQAAEAAAAFRLELGDQLQSETEKELKAALEEVARQAVTQSMFLDTDKVINAERVKAILEKYMKDGSDTLAIAKALQEINMFAEPPLPYTKAQMLASYVRAARFGGAGYGPDMLLEPAL